MHVRLTEDAIADLDSIEEYLEPRNPQGLQRVFSAIFTTISQLETFPFLGRTGRIDGTREIVVPHTPFMIIYSLNEAQYIDIDRNISYQAKTRRLTINDRIRISTAAFQGF